MKLLDSHFRGNDNSLVFRQAQCPIIPQSALSVILNPSHVILSEAKNLIALLRVDSANNLIITTCYKLEILWLTPQNDILYYFAICATGLNRFFNIVLEDTMETFFQFLKKISKIIYKIGRGCTSYREKIL